MLRLVRLIGCTLIILGSSVILWGQARAAELRIGLGADVSSLDPHFINIAPNIALSTHLFDALIQVDAEGRLTPGLAESWRAVDATTWEFKLRKGVKFHDGSELTADDVLFSLDRPAALRGSPGPFTSFTKMIIAKHAVNPYTVRLKTASAYGPLPLDLASIFIVSKKAAIQATPDDFNNGKAAIGTGPFQLRRFKRGEVIELSRNDRYWGEKPAWAKVRFRILPSNIPRLSALLAGDVDMIENVPSADVARIKADTRFQLAEKTSWRTLFWHMDQFRASTPFIHDNAGRPLSTNPLKDRRVRQALSKAINREALSARVLEGRVIPAGNLVSPGILGHDTALKVDAYDPAGAKKLLSAAGYPNGFRLTLHSPNNRYPNDAQVAQTVAQFFSRVGVETQVETQPFSSYLGPARAGRYSMALLGWGSLAGDFALRSLLGTPDNKTGWGSWNWGRYRNPALDRQIANALRTVDEAQRAPLARAAMTTAMRDYAVVPLYHQIATWALRQGLRYEARTDEFTLAHQVRAEQ